MKGYKMFEMPIQKNSLRYYDACWSTTKETNTTLECIAAEPKYEFISNGNAFIIIQTSVSGIKAKTIVKCQNDVESNKFDALNWCLVKHYLITNGFFYFPTANECKLYYTTNSAMKLVWKYLKKYGTGEVVADVVKEFYSKDFLKSVYKKMNNVEDLFSNFSFEIVLTCKDVKVAK